MRLTWVRGEPLWRWALVWFALVVMLCGVGFRSLAAVERLNERSVSGTAVVVSRTVLVGRGGSRDVTVKLRLLAPGFPTKVVSGSFDDAGLRTPSDFVNVRYDPENPKMFLPSWEKYGSNVEGPFSLAAVAFVLGIVQVVRCGRNMPR